MNEQSCVGNTRSKIEDKTPARSSKPREEKHCAFANVCGVWRVQRRCDLRVRTDQRKIRAGGEGHERPAIATFDLQPFQPIDH